MECLYKECDLHRRFGTEFCPTDTYESCPVYQVWREQEQMLEKKVGLSTEQWDKINRICGWYQDG